MKTELKQDAKERLIGAGMEVFAEQGFDAATTRMISEKAGVNLASIPYYFQSKEGLYRSVLDKIGTAISSRLSPVLDEIDRCADPKALDAKKAEQLLEHLMGTMIEAFCGYSEAAKYGQIIMREQMHPSSAYDLIYNRIMKRVLGAMTSLTVAMTGQKDARKASIRAFSLVGQMLVFRFARETIVRFLGLEGYNEREIMEIREVLISGTVEGLKAQREN